MANGNGDHWIVKGLNGVNILTLLALVLGGASLYYQLDKDIALMKRDIQAIEQRLTTIQRQLTSSSSMPYQWPERS